MRAFIAIELPKEIKSALSKIQEQLKSTGADAKWVAPENIHLTLKFLGEIDDKKLDKIGKIMEDTALEKKQFQIRISGIGAFPKMNFPRVIWAGVDKGDKETKEITKVLEDKIEKLGILKEDRPFSSHITIGRTRSTLNRERLVQELNKLASQTANLYGEWEFSVAKITLFKSTITPSGPIYDVLKETSLQII